MGCGVTSIRLSDSTLDALADARQRGRPSADPDTRYSPMGACPPTLDCGGHSRVVIVNDRHGNPHLTHCCYLHEARREWYYAHPEDLHVFRVPSDVEIIPIVGAVLDAGELGGPPFAPEFVSYLQAPREPIVRGLREYRRKCAGQHGTWPEHRGRVVCGILLWSTVANGNPIDFAADEIGLTPGRASELLYAALRLIWGWRSQQVNGT